jgi:hypothetical protein
MLSAMIERLQRKEREDGFVMQASEKPAHDRTFAVQGQFFSLVILGQASNSATFDTTLADLRPN